MNNQLYEQDFHLWRESIIKNYITEAYADARKLAIKESKKAKLGVRKLTDAEYPLDCLFLIEQLLDEDFYGDSD